MVYFKLPILKVLSFLSDKKDFVLLETNKYSRANYKSFLFFNSLNKLELFSASCLEEFFKKIEDLAEKYYLAGYFTYELGYCLNDICFVSSNHKTPMIVLGVFDNVIIFDHKKNRFKQEYFERKTADIFQLKEFKIKDLNLDIKKTDYIQKIKKIKEYLLQGQTYQVNFTDKYMFDFSGCPFSLYADLRQKQEVAYSAFVKFGSEYILSFSPELFFKRSQNQIFVKPMKGTIKRGRNLIEDREQQEILKNDYKNQAENLMIVDLLRNDLGRISELGSVKVKKIFEIEKYNTLFQMTSTVCGKLKSGVKWLDVFKGLFPCGSVTGAPKKSTMQIIKELEKKERGVYCGALGFISPENKAVFNVPIRTVVLNNKKGEMGSGGGIVFDSVPLEEFKELQLKAKFLLEKSKTFELLETILWCKEYFLLDLHLKRLADSAKYFDFSFDYSKIFYLLQKICKNFPKENSYKVRLILNKEGEVLVDYEELIKKAKVFEKIILSLRKTNSSNIFLFHKTTNREFYNSEFVKYSKLGYADVIFKNEKGEITEGAISNVFIKKNNLFYTPPITCGLLNGIFRQYFMKRNKVIEKILFEKDLRKADSILICNSVRGIRKAKLCFC